MAVEFTGSDDEYIGFGSDASIDNIFDGGGSLVSFVLFDVLDTDYQIATKYSSFMDGWRFMLNLGTAPDDEDLTFNKSFSGDNGRWRTPQSSLSSGVWHHVAVVYNADSVSNDPKLYIDGVSQTVTEVNTPSGSSSSDAGANLWYGANPELNFELNGKLGEVRAFDKELTDELVALLSLGYKGPVGGEVLWATLMDAKGVNVWSGTSLGTSNILPDLSGNGNDGTPQNTPTARAYDGPWFMPFVMQPTIPVQTQLDLAGAISPSGALIQEHRMTAAGSITPSGSITSRLISYVSLVGSISPSGAIDGFKRFVSVAGSITPSGSIATRFIEILRGVVSFAKSPSADIDYVDEPEADVSFGKAPEGDISDG